MTKKIEEPQFQKKEVHKMEMSDVKNESVKTIRVFIAGLAANLSALAVGTGISWTSPVLPKLNFPNTPNSPLNHVIDRSDIAWIGSTMSIGAAICPFIAGPLSDKFGRKRTLLSSATLFITAYTLLIFATEVWIMLLARLIKGFGISFVFSVLPMYLGEIATDNVRGALGSLFALFICVGYTSVLCIGPFVSYYALQYFCLAVPIAFFIVFAFMPESPYFYVAKNQRKKAQSALQFLRGQSIETIEYELTSIEVMVETSMAQKGTFMDLIRNRANRKALVISLGLMTFQQLTGINAILFNIQWIFESANMGLDAAVGAIIVASVQVLMSVFTSLIADRIRRKTLLLTSGFFMGVALALLGCFFLLKYEMGFKTSINWIAIFSLVLYIAMFAIGFAPIPWTILSEIFAPNIKPIACSIVSSHCWIIGFIVPLFYPFLQALGVYYPFLLFALCCIVACLFIYFFVIETRGLSLLDIQNKLGEKYCCCFIFFAPKCERILVVVIHKKI